MQAPGVSAVWGCGAPAQEVPLAALGPPLLTAGRASSFTVGGSGCGPCGLPSAPWEGLPAAPLAFSFPYGQVSLEDQGPARYDGHNAYAITPGLSLVPCKPVPHPAPPSLLPAPREISALVSLGAGGPGSVGALGSSELRDLPVDFPAVSRFKPQF